MDVRAVIPIRRAPPAPRPLRQRRPAGKGDLYDVCLSVTLCVMISGIVARTSDCLFRATMGNQAVLR